MLPGKFMLHCGLVIVAFMVVTLITEKEWFPTASAEYGDIVINNFSEKAGMRPVIFPHWFHRIRFRCKVCHADLNFKFKAGGNDITMLKIFDGQFCGACHDSRIAWGVENCVLCHSGVPAMRTRVHNSTIDRLIKVPGSPGR